MGLLDFLRNKGQGKVENKFIGRHQQKCFVRQTLGEAISDMEIQIATNKDLGEKNEILKKLQQLEEYIRSEFFTTQFDVASANKDIGNIIDAGYKTCVLQNDSEIENRCFQILEDTIEYIKNFAKKKETLADDEITGLNKMLDLSGMIGWFAWLNLGGLLKTAEEEQAWLIITSLLHSRKKIGGFNASNLITHVLAILPSKDVNDEASSLRKIKNTLIDNKKISEAEGHRIDDMIKAGLIQNKEIHRQYPDRP